MENSVEFEVYGKYAMFTDPITKLGGEKTSYSIPTYEAIKGICKSIYWKPTFIWVVDEVRIMNKIQFETKGVRTLKNWGGFKGTDVTDNDLCYYTYLKDVRYKVKAHIEWNFNRDELANDRNLVKHLVIANKMIDRGGRQDIFLGTRECQAFVEPTTFDDESGPYDGVSIPMSLMYHSTTYPDEAFSRETDGRISTHLWTPIIENGTIKFIKPCECNITRHLHEMKMKKFGVEYSNFTPVESESV